MIRVTAHDDDSGSNADITYSISSTDENSLSLFNIDSKTGIITASKQLDAESQTFHLIHVSATDHGEQRKSSFTSINITVLDINDNKPTFNTNEIIFFIDDIRSRDQFIGKIDAFDADVNHTLTYSLKKQSSYLDINSLNGILSIKSRPTPSTIIKTHVVVTDGVHSVEAELIINVNTRNENRPYVPHVIHLKIKEDLAVKKKSKISLMNLAVNDADMGKYSQLYYQIDSDVVKKYFKVDAKGMLFKTKRLIDREKISKMVVPVRVTDGGGLFTLTKVIIEIQDENDETPMFEFPLYQTNIMTSQMSEESLLHVVAKDLDVGANAELKYNAQGLE